MRDEGDQLESYHDETPLAASDDDTLLQSTSIDDPVDDDTPQQYPWMQRVSDNIPSPLKRISRAVVTWAKGPQPPRIYKIEPFFPSIQHAPLALLDRYAPKKMQRFWLLFVFYICWILSFALILHKSSFAADVQDYGSPVRLGCTARYWNDGNGCGINGDQCRPFSNASLPFRCPAGCIKTQVLFPHAVGDQEVVYKPLVIGGPTNKSEPISSTVYRGDSFICGSAIHAGFIKSEQGGCGVLKLTGDRHFFPSVKQHGIDSIGFESYFPQSFQFVEGTQSQCKDLRWPLLAVSVFFTAMLSIFTTSPAVFFWSIFVGLFFQTGLASDPPNLTDYYSLISTALGRFLPAAFVMAIIYRYAVRYSLTGLTAQFEKTILWLGAAWVGALNNYTFDRIPIQRLTPHDIKAQPGAIPALISIVLIIFFIALGQAYAFRVEGRMPRYLVVYGLFVGGILLLVAVPGGSILVGMKALQEKIKVLEEEQPHMLALKNTVDQALANQVTRIQSLEQVTGSKTAEQEVQKQEVQSLQKRVSELEEKLEASQKETKDLSKEHAEQQEKHAQMEKSMIQKYDDLFALVQTKLKEFVKDQDTAEESYNALRVRLNHLELGNDRGYDRQHDRGHERGNGIRSDHGPDHRLERGHDPYERPNRFYSPAPPPHPLTYRNGYHNELGYYEYGRR
ncbi:hypothetical protein D6C97_07376 [Aureobasidium pullulans]|nr:hypothetical protein D6C97_07376 [Aureobasidium pullulans]